MTYQAVGQASATSEAQKFLTKVYGWMVFALALSAVASLLPYISPALMTFVLRGYIVLAIAEVALVLVLSFGIRKMSTSAAGLCFVLYSLVNGLTLTSIYMVFTTGSIINVFVTCALMFGVMTFYGVTTKRNLNTMANYLMMALIGIIIAGLLNFFLHSSALDFAVAVIGVVVFTGLTAYDTQKIMYSAKHADGREAFNRVAIIAALNLYLDFINLFLQLLRLFGRKRD